MFTICCTGATWLDPMTAVVGNKNEKGEWKNKIRDHMYCATEPRLIHNSIFFSFLHFVTVVFEDEDKHVDEPRTKITSRWRISRAWSTFATSTWSCSRLLSRTWKVTTLVPCGWELTGKVIEYLVKIWPHELISTSRKLFTSVRGYEVKMKSGWEAGERVTAWKPIEHANSKRNMQINVVLQQETREDGIEVRRSVAERWSKIKAKLT